jgi:hypothetical protein
VTERYLLALAEALSSCLGISEPDPGDVPELAETSRGPWFDALMTATRAAVRALPDPSLAEETRNHQILIHYLRAYDRLGTTIDELNRRDMQQSLAITEEGPELDDHAEKAGNAADEATLRFLLRKTCRNRLLWRTVLDRSRRAAAPVARPE